MSQQDLQLVNIWNGGHSEPLEFYCILPKHTEKKAGFAHEQVLLSITEYCSCT